MQKLIGLLLIIMASHGYAEAKLYRWIDSKGQIQYSDKPPPSDAKLISELDKRAIVRKHPEPPLTTEERLRQDAERQRQLDQERYDKALLQSYTGGTDIDTYRDNQAELVKSRLRSSQQRLQDRKQKLAAQIKQADEIRNAKRNVPASLSDGITESSREIATLEEEVRLREQELKRVYEKAEYDKKRLQELKAGVSASKASQPPGSLFFPSPTK